MDQAYYNSCLWIDRGILKDNILHIMHLLPESSQLIPVLKCNAYGLGLKEMTCLIREIPGIRMIAVAQMIEALQVRAADDACGILVLGGTVGDVQYRAAVEQDITLNACRTGMIPALAEQARTAGKEAMVHIKINTGLNRLGVSPGAELDALLSEIMENRDAVKITGVFSHFSDLLGTEDGAMKAQIRLFEEAVRQIRAAGFQVPMRHICASAAWEMHPEWALDAVRIGRRLSCDHPTQPDGGVEEAVSWRARVLDVRLRRAGEHIGYGGEICLEKDTRIALLGIGYGDGLNTSLAGLHAPVLLHGKRARLLGCCMDMCYVDTCGIPCAVGDEITLFGRDGHGNILPAREIAGMISDEACTLTTAIGPRVQRVYE